MRVTHLTILGFASATLAAPAFTFPAFTFPYFPRKTTTTKAVTSTPAPTVPSIKIPIVSATPTPSIPSPSAPAAPPSVSAAPPSPSPSSSSPPPPPPPQGNCTPQGSGGGSTENGVVNGNCCTDVTVVFARGTGESGNVGAGAGPPMFKALRGKIGAARVTVQGVDYPADSAGNSQQGGTGGATMASLVKQALSQCPNTKVVVSGYSQGGMVVHKAFTQGISSKQVAAAVQFGDPQNGSPVGDLASSKVLQICHDGDHVCDGSGTFSITQAHLTYGNDAGTAAEFIISTLGL